MMDERFKSNVPGKHSTPETQNNHRIAEKQERETRKCPQ